MDFKEIIQNTTQLEAILGKPSEVVINKSISIIDQHCKTFINNSPFLTIATADAKGNMDVSPKGDPAGFVKVLDEKTIAIPDRKGNRRADTFRNVLERPKCGILFIIPGIRETLRVNGTAQIVTDLDILEQLAHQGKLPQLALIVNVEEAFMHCAKCIIRSNLWTNHDPDIKNKIPSLATIVKDHAALDVPLEALEHYLKEDEKNGLY